MLGGISLALLIFIILFFFSYRQTQQANSTGVSIALSHEVFNQTAKILSTITDNETGSRGFILTGNEDFLEPFQRSKNTIHQQIDTLKKFSNGNISRQQAITSLLLYVDKRIAFSDSTILCRKEKGLQPAIELVSTGRGKFYSDNIRRIIGQMQLDENRLLKQKKEESTIQIRLWQIAFLTIAFIMLGLMIILFWKEKKRIELKVRQSSQDELELLSIQINQSNDAIYTIDASRKITSWNRGAQKLYGFTKEEALGEDSNELLQTTFTNEEINTVLQKIAEQDYWAGELKRKSKNGASVYVRSSTTTIKDNKESITGFIVVNVDITDQKKLNEQINHLANLVEQSSEAIFSRDLVGRIISWNRGAEKLFGYSKVEAIGKTATELGFIKLTGDEILAMQKQVAENGSWKAERNYYNKDGGSFFGAVTGNLIKDEKGKATSFYFIVKDISLQKKLEENLKRSNEELEEKVKARTEEIYKNEKRFRALIENIDEGISMTDELSNNLYSSPSAKKILGGITKENIPNLSHPDDLEALTNKRSEAFNNPGVPVTHQGRFLHASGKYIWLELTLTNLIHVKGINAVVSNFRDITYQKEAELKLIKANRLYLFISQINQMIVRTTNEETLFKEACQIAVGLGKFRMAWIGMLDEATRKIIPVIHVGEEKGYLSKIEIISLDDVPEGRGPTGIATREGRYIVCNDIESAPQMAPWKEAAVSRGYLSSISLPIKRGDKVIGAFTLYAGEKNFFDAEEIALLQEATSDISFALDVFGKESLRKKAEELVLESEQRYQTLTEMSPVGIFHTDVTGNTTYVNPHWSQISGLSFKEAFGNGWLNAVHPEDKKVLKASWENAISIQEIFISEYRFVRPDGSIAWVMGQATPERNSKKQIVGYIGTITDITEHKLAENLILKEKQLTDTLINNLPGIFYLYDSAGNFIRWNKNFENVTGFTTDEISKMSPFDFYDEKQKIDNRIKMVFEKITPGIEIEILTKKKNKIPYFINSIAIEYEGKQCLLGMGLDLSERKRAVDEIKKANERYELIGKATNDGVWDWNLETDQIWGNEMHQQMYGLTIADPIPDYEAWKQRIHPEDREKAVKFFEESRDLERMSFIEEFRFFNEEKGWINLLCRTFAERDDNGKAVRLIGSMMDITYRKKAEESLKLSNERYNLVSKATNDSIWDLDIISGIITRTGDGFKTLFGYDNDSGINNDELFMSLIHPDDLVAVKASEGAAFNNPDEFYWEREYRLLKANGQYAYVYDKGYIIRDEKGNAVRMIGATQDVTSLKETEINLRKLNENLQQQAKELADSNAELEQFAYVASHDLQEPLRMVTSFLTLLEKKYGEIIDGNGKKYIHFAVDGAKRMKQIILDILEFSRVGRMDNEKKEVHLQELVNEIKQLFRKQIEEKAAVIETVNLPVIIADEPHLRQVFQNLIGNALKYTNIHTVPQIKITATEQETHWLFSVKDNGIGIEKEYFDRIFIIFQRLHNQNDFSGTGIGLAITKKIIENLGGKIWLESKPGKGSTFYFTIKSK